MQPDRGARILVIEDELPMPTALQDCLEGEGYRVLTAAEGETGLSRALKEKPDLILLDIMLPRMDGYNICHLVRNNPEYRDLPIIMLSGKDGIFDKMRGKLAGSTDYITKPFDSAELVQVVKRHLEGIPLRDRSGLPARPERLRREV